jgi:hypothetical protein
VPGGAGAGGGSGDRWSGLGTRCPRRVPRTPPGRGSLGLGAVECPASLVTFSFVSLRAVSDLLFFRRPATDLSSLATSLLRRPGALRVGRWYNIAVYKRD